MTPATLTPTPITVSIVVPVFNEAASIAPFLERVRGVFGPELKSLPGVQALEIIFVNDGSTDGTLPTLLAAQSAQAAATTSGTSASTRTQLVIVDLSRNFGKEAALTAGLCTATGDVVVPIDVDLQDPPELIGPMIEKWREGYEVVLARRSDRSTDSLSKRLSAEWFYKIHNRISDLKLPHNVGDYRLMDRSVIEALKELPESRRFMKGLFAWIGFRTATLDYTRDERAAGSSKFNGWKLWNFALEGVTSFSEAPLRLWTYAGSIIALLSMFYGTWIAVRTLLFGADLPGYPSIFVAVTFFGGLQLIGIGVLGEYLGRTYIESKRRPIYVVRKVHRDNAAC